MLVFSNYLLHVVTTLLLVVFLDKFIRFVLSIDYSL
jgi:hypothetical protein